MKQKILNVFKPSVFLAIGFFIFLYIQDVLTVDDLNNGTSEKAILGFNALEEDSADVLILGTSHPEFGISSMKLYENTGIVSYNLSSSQQPIEVSYYVLKRAFETQSPKVVLLDPEALFNDGSELKNAVWRIQMD